MSEIDAFAARMRTDTPFMLQVLSLTKSIENERYQSNKDVPDGECTACRQTHSDVAPLAPFNSGMERLCPTCACNSARHIYQCYAADGVTIISPAAGLRVHDPGEIEICTRCGARRNAI